MKKTYAYRNGRMVQVKRRVNLFTGEVFFERPYEPLDISEAIRSMELFLYGGAVGHTFKGGTYRVDGTPLPY